MKKKRKNQNNHREPNQPQNTKGNHQEQKGRRERRIVAELGNSHAEQLHDELSEVGFRRSHGVVYKPACPNCRECIPVRIVLSDFLFSRSQKRVWTKNIDLIAEILPPVASKEQYNLFAKYQLESPKEDW